jgi:hypothetical protein
MDNAHNKELELWVVGCTTGSRGEVPGERKPMIRDDDNNNHLYTFHTCGTQRM